VQQNLFDDLQNFLFNRAVFVKPPVHVIFILATALDQIPPPAGDGLFVGSAALLLMVVNATPTKEMVDLDAEHCDIHVGFCFGRL